MMENHFELDWEFDSESAQLVRSADELISDQNLQLLAKKNRLSVYSGTLPRYQDPGTKQYIKPFEFRCESHPHPECKLDHFVFSIKLMSPHDAKIVRLTPKSITGDTPIRIERSQSVGLSFEYKKVKGTLAELKESHSLDIYFPEIQGSGEGSSFARWTFKKPLDSLDLMINCPLVLEILDRDTRPSLEAAITFRGRLSRKGWPGYIPLIGQKSFNFELKERL